jgi:lipopolysaccharide/colanic/teichoic acid biosynthesis glycosyltransferase
MKRVIDICVALIGLVLFFIPILVLAFLVRLRLGSPIFFRQTRPGLHAKPFNIIKFRTLTDDRDAEGKLLADEQRITNFGSFLRASSLDELPELWNVLIGNMSLVGPRPLLMEYLPLYTKEQSRRHDVKPGVTGWAQINGRNLISWEEKFKYDNWYVDNQNLMLDFQILLITLIIVLNRRGVSPVGLSTMPAFTGNRIGFNSTKDQKFDK